MNDAGDFYIRDLKYKDRLGMKKWGYFENPLLEGYNYSDMSEKDLDYWYRTRKKSLRNRTFVVIHRRDGFIGYIAMKRINPILKSSVLGIVFDPNHTSKGYGTRAMNLFLVHYFQNLKMRYIDLDVNEFNNRARKMYESLGFSYIGEYYDEFENQKIDINFLQANGFVDNFIYSRGRWYSKILKMRLKREEYFSEIHT